MSKCFLSILNSGKLKNRRVVIIIIVIAFLIAGVFLNDCELVDEAPKNTLLSPLHTNRTTPLLVLWLPRDQADVGATFTYQQFRLMLNILLML